VAEISNINFDFFRPPGYRRKRSENQLKSTHIIHRLIDIDESYLLVDILTLTLKKQRANLS
jgi:hypothetical protein